jgi:hypothetical protein
MSEKISSLDAILGDFGPAKSKSQKTVQRSSVTLTLWVPVEMKERYDRLQRLSGKAFSKKAREILEAAIQIAESKAS